MATVLFATFWLSAVVHAQAPVWSYEVVGEYPHDPDAFTQGLVFEDGLLYESTGLYGRSEVRHVELATGDLLQSRKLPDYYFGEGLAKVDGRLLQLTYKEQRCLVYVADSLRRLRRHFYLGEGWGLASSGDKLFMSNGSHVISVRDPTSFRVVDRLLIKDGDTPVEGLNELEVIEGLIWANVFPTSRIVVIDPLRERVIAWLDLSDLARQQRPGADVLNGIAYDAIDDRIFVTGKLWSTLYEIQVAD